jgi:hypothetical protein
MKLKSFGCSFIFGSDLQDSLVLSGNTKASQQTWPAHLARHLGYGYECHASPGSGNLQILERMLNQILTSSSDDLFVIGWTWIDRFDYYDTNHNPYIKNTPWNTIMPIDDSVVAKTYYKQLHSEYRDKFTGLTYIKLAIDTLDQRGIPYIMTYMDALLFDTRWHISPSVTEFQQYIKPCMTTFDGKSFLEWSRGHEYAESKTWHPLEEAHAAAGSYMCGIYQKHS